MTGATYDINDIKRRMQGAITTLKHEFGGLRTGRASATLLDPVQVEAYGTQMPLNQLATVSVPEPRLLSVQVWDKSMVTPATKAIQASNLGLNPSVDGQVIRLRIPELNEERRRELVKVAHKYAEAAKVEGNRGIRIFGVERWDNASSQRGKASFGSFAKRTFAPMLLRGRRCRASPPYRD